MTELVTVLAIVGIGASIATPKLDAYVNQTRARRGLDNLVTDLAYARLLAVREGRKTAVRLQENGAYRIEVQTPAGAWETKRTVNLRNDYGTVSFVESASAIEFSSRGMVSNLANEAVVKLATNGSRDSLWISLAGRTYREF